MTTARVGIFLDADNLLPWWDKRKVGTAVQSDFIKRGDFIDFTERLEAAAAAHGEVVLREAYGNWSQEARNPAAAILHFGAGYELQHVPSLGGENLKNAGDILLAARSLLAAAFHPDTQLDTVIVAASDKDYYPLAAELHRLGKRATCISFPLNNPKLTSLLSSVFDDYQELEPIPRWTQLKNIIDEENRARQARRAPQASPAGPINAAPAPRPAPTSTPAPAVAPRRVTTGPLTLTQSRADQQPPAPELGPADTEPTPVLPAIAPRRQNDLTTPKPSSRLSPPEGQPARPEAHEVFPHYTSVEALVSQLTDAAQRARGQAAVALRSELKRLLQTTPANPGTLLVQMEQQLLATPVTDPGNRPSPAHLDASTRLRRSLIEALMQETVTTIKQQRPGTPDPAREAETLIRDRFTHLSPAAELDLRRARSSAGTGI